MSITRLAIDNDRVTIVAVLLVLFGGLISYAGIPKREDPGFTIRWAFIATAYPGASPERVEDLSLIHI